MDLLLKIVNYSAAFIMFMGGLILISNLIAYIVKKMLRRDIHLYLYITSFILCVIFVSLCYYPAI